MGFQRQACSIRVVGLHLWSQTQLFVRQQSGGNGIGLGISPMKSVSNHGQRENGRWEGVNEDLWSVMPTQCTEGRLKDPVHILDLMDQGGIQAHLDTYIHLLQGCTKLKSLAHGKQVHSHIIKNGFETAFLLGNALINMYAKCGSMVDALQVFDRMVKRDVVSWTAMIAGFAQQGLSEETFHFFLQMEQEGVKPNRVTFLSILNACASPAALDHGKWVHARIIKAGFESDVRVGNALVSMYCKCGSLADARQMFKKMPIQDVVSWTAIIAGSAQLGHDEEAFQLFQQMQEKEVKPNRVTFMSILNACASPEAIAQGKQVHTSIIQAGFASDNCVGNALVSMYVKCGKVEDAQQVFDKMQNRDVISWTTMIAGFAEHGRGEEAWDLFQQMQQVGVKPNRVTFMSILNACASPETLQQGKGVHIHIIKAGYESDVRVANALVSMYVRCGSIMDAYQVFNKMLKRDVVSWTAIITGYTQLGQSEEVFGLFQKMQGEGMKPDKVTFISILNACACPTALEQGKWVHAQAMKVGFEADTCVGTALVKMYCKCGSVVDARQVFDKMHMRDVLSWTAMIAGYAQHGFGKEALQVFAQMQVEGVKPNKVTFVAVLSACSHAGLVDEGHHFFHSMTQDHGVTPTVEHYGCMVDLLGRAGHLVEAEDLISKLPFKPGVSMWGALLGACRIHGNVDLAKRAAERALQLEPENAGVYALLSNIYATAGRWDDRAEVRKQMEDRSLKKEAGRSWIEVENIAHSFVSGDRSHPQTEEIYGELEGLNRQMKEAGYVPDTRFLLHDVGDWQKELTLCHHSEKLAIAFGLISTPPGTPIRIFKNLRVCGDCHNASKIISKIVGREIIARDSKRYHYFQNGVCSCGDYW